MNCASCGTTLPDQALFCPGCGQRITVQRRVPVAAEPSYSRPMPAPAPSRSALPNEELHAAVAARHELGERMEQEVIDSFLARVEQSLDARIDERVGRQLHGRRPSRIDPKQFTGRVAASLGLGIPLTAISGGIGGVFGIIAVWLGIVVLNVYYTEVEKQQD
jgi:hypothetical protein